MIYLQVSWWSKLFLCTSLLVVALDNVHAQMAQGNCKFLGNVISAAVPADFDKYWNQVTPENAGKWGSVEAVRNEMVWDQLDIAYEHAQTNNYPFKQHTLVWGQQQPEWLAALTAEEQKAEVEEWIKAFCERYPDTDYIDVVNEPLHAVPSYFNALGGSGVTGWDWIIWAFEKTREYCPNAKLILNDYSILNNASATTQYLQIIKVLQDRNLIDVIGEQGHFFETTPLATLKSNLDRFHETGLPVQISEYDVNLTSDTEQKNVLQEQFTTFWSHPAVQGITLWGYRQGQIWRTNAYLVRSNNTERPALTWLKSYVASTNVEGFCTVTSVEDTQKNIFTVYPNPSVGRVTVEFVAPFKELSISDMKGNQVKSLTPAGIGSTVDLDLLPGMYLLRVKGMSGSGSAKVLVL